MLSSVFPSSIWGLRPWVSLQLVLWGRSMLFSWSSIGSYWASDSSGLFSLCMDVLERIWSLSPVAPVKVRKDAFIGWSRQSSSWRSSWRSLFIISCWCLWTWRNVHIFQGSKEPLQVIIQQILACHESLHQKAYSPNVLASWFWVFFSCSGMLVPVLWISVSWQSDLLLFFPMCISVR